MADLIAFVASASSTCEGSTSEYIDSFGSQCLSVFRSLGLPSTAVLIRVCYCYVVCIDEVCKMGEPGYTNMT